MASGNGQNQNVGKPNVSGTRQQGNAKEYLKNFSRPAGKGNKKSNSAQQGK